MDDEPEPSVGDPATGDPGEVEIRVLGPVEVRGAARPLSRAWTLDLVVYLAMHRRPVPNEQWAAALWPDRVLAAPTLHSTVSAARRALGRSGGGGDHLPHRHGALCLGPSVTTDWQRFARLAALPDPDAWRSALDLVRGRPFDGLRSPDWTVLEGVAATVEGAVVDLALRLAERDLAAGEGRRATAAARRGLRAGPYDERLFRVLLRAADQQGNPAGVESVMDELVWLVAGEAAPAEAVGGAAGAEACLHPETLAVYRSVSRRRAPRAGGVLARL